VDLTAFTEAKPTSKTVTNPGMQEFAPRDTTFILQIIILAQMKVFTRLFLLANPSPGIFAYTFISINLFPG
jgi:hypothetical protein